MLYEGMVAAHRTGYHWQITS